VRLAPFVLLAGCAGVAPALHPAPPGVDKYGDAVDWNAAGDETAQLLSEYLKVDTFNPPGNETRGAQWLGSVLMREGVPFTITDGDRGNLVARLAAPNATEKPLCLLSHTDVVTAEAEKWAHPPLSGEIAGGYVWGRGALDMKGMGVIELMTLLTLKRHAVPLKRDVVLIAVSDEEVGNTGMRAAVAENWPDCGHLINEGGLGLRDVLMPGQTVFSISVAEKGVLWLKLRARGEAGHGSTPIPGRAPMELLHAAAALMSREPEPRIHASMYELLRRAGEHRGGFNGFVMQRPALVNLLVTKRLMQKPTTRAVVTNTCQVTGYSGIGSSTNVIPSEAYANIDCRVLPGTEPEALLAELNARIAGLPGVSLEVVEMSPASESTWDDELFDALARHAVRGRDDAIAGPVLSPGYTDSMHARKKGARAYGFIPFELSQEELGQMHGRDERVSLANLKRGLEVLFRSVVDVAAAVNP
jgi:acetylornithine deacetylase/succinyl-diaminopimelate desuccinylase-like protein